MSSIENGEAGGRAPDEPAAPITGEPKLPGEVRAWGFVSLCSDLAHETVTAALPALLTGFGAAPIALGLVEGCSDGVALLAKLWGGRLADRLQRLKPIAASGYALTALALPAIALAHTWPLVLALRAVGWLGRGLRAPLRDTLLARAVPTDRRGRAFGLERAMDQVGAVLAPLALVGLAALSGSPQLAIAAALVPGAASVLVLLLGVREHPRELDPGRAVHDRRAHLPPACRSLLLAVTVFGCGDFAKTLIILWALGSRPEWTPGGLLTAGALLYAFYNAITVLAAWSGGALSDRVGRRNVLAVAYALGAGAALVPVIAQPGLPAALLALAASGWLVGTEEAVERAAVADLAPPELRGRAFGWLHALNGIGDLVASAGVGLLWTAAGPHVAFAAAAALMGTGTVLTALLPGRARWGWSAPS
ncbi:MAG: MFS transporter [Planctomycetota bacterium]|nr:MAG: MFS transporter [Planctomycetota bacterium]